MSTRNKSNNKNTKLKTNNQYIIKTSIGYFDKDSFTMVNDDISKASKISENRIMAYFDSICNDIALINKQDIKAEYIRVEE